MHRTMENIKEEEEAHPLTSPNRRVVEAYSTNDRQKNCRKYAFWLMAFSAFVIVSTGGGGSGGSDKKRKRAKKLRNKAETMPEVEVKKIQQINNKIDRNEKYAQLIDAHAKYEDSEDAGLINSVMQGEDDLDRELDHVFDGVEMAEQDEIDANNSMLSTAVKTMEDSVKFYLDKVFGNGEDDDDDDDDMMTDSSADVKLTEEQLDQIAKKISDRLEMDVKNQFREKADFVKDEKVSEIEKVVDEDRDANMEAHEIEKDVKTAESLVMEDLKDEIEDAAEQIKEEIPERVKKIRSDVVEEVTGKKLERIEQRKREKKQKKLEMMQKFHKMQAKQREAEAKKIHELSDETLGLKQTKSRKRKQNQRSGSETGRNSNQGDSVKDEDNNWKRNKKEPKVRGFDEKIAKFNDVVSKKSDENERVKHKQAKAESDESKSKDPKRFHGSTNEKKNAELSTDKGSKGKIRGSDDDAEESGPSVDESNHSGDTASDGNSENGPSATQDEQ